MRRAPVLIAGGGPAGAAAAITLARGGARPLLVERSTGPRDVVCGGFLGWDALQRLRALGLDPAALGARPITRLRLVANGRAVEADLPHVAAGLSRRTLDEALLAKAEDSGAQLLRGRAIKSAQGTRLRLDGEEELTGAALFLATGKHELRGAVRPTNGRAVSTGLRAALPPDGARTRALAGVIELHLLRGGYAGLLLQEDGSANFCLSVEKMRLAEAGGIAPLLAALAEEAPLMAERLDGYDGSWDAVAGVPYGWRAATTEPAVYRLGDQAAVIASLAGDGVAIALASGAGAAQAFLRSETAASWQRSFARQSARPITIAEGLRHTAEQGWGHRLLTGLAAWSPVLARTAARLTRIG